MKNYLLGIDLGTTNVKAVLFTETGKAVAMGEKSYPTYYPEPNSAEQDANEWWEATAESIRQITSVYPVTDGKIAGISVSSQSPTLLPLDADGKPLKRGMIWMDRRAEEESRWIEAQFGKERFKDIFGMQADAFYLSPKLLWLKKNEPEIYKKTKKILLTNTYISYKLTGVMSIDHSQATSVALAYDQEQGCWSEELERVLDIPLHDLLPDVYAMHEVIGVTTSKAAEETGLCEGIPVVCGCMDGTANSLEVGLTRIGDAAEITGTSTLFSVAHDKPVDSPSLFTTSYTEPFAIPEVPYMLAGAVNSTGASLKWYVNAHKEYMDILAERRADKNVYNALNEIAEQGPAGSNGLIYFPYLSGERSPYWKSYLKGMFVGLTAASTQQHIIRSIYEGTSFALRHVVEVAMREGAVIDNFRSSGGGANSDIWLKIKASMLKMPLNVSTGMGGAPVGDAILAGYGVGIYKDLLKAVETFKHIDKVVDPVEPWVKIYDDLYPLFLSMVDNLDGDLKQMEAVVKKQNRQ